MRLGCVGGRLAPNVNSVRFCEDGIRKANRDDGNASVHRRRRNQARVFSRIKPYMRN